MIVDTAGCFPEGKGYIMECSAVLEEVVRKGTTFWQFNGTTDLDGVKSAYNEAFPIWLAGPLFAALGFKEVSPGKYDVEPTNALGRKFKCDIVHEKVNDKVYARIKNAVPLQFKNKDVQKAADEESIPF